MNTAHIHLLLNHLPVIGTVVAIALLAWALLRRNADLTRVSFAMFGGYCWRIGPLLAAGGIP